MIGEQSGHKGIYPNLAGFDKSKMNSSEENSIASVAKTRTDNQSALEGKGSSVVQDVIVDLSHYN